MSIGQKRTASGEAREQLAKRLIAEAVAESGVTRSDAYLLARANKHKPWARRWLRQHGEWV